ncbi:Ribonucleoprotein like [Heracleum sosnowskyi]|uniref:Ribonucleoprotein like n=1 Tax=Heracleum sosnowskyi TaxID=360622 RepID=A0AAD8H6H4_9APIA|nr:Ribonucleoprotein like [Heracleum sosnowskyi]
MGCGGSKVDNLPLVIRCRERKKLIKAAVDQRYAFSTAHILYLRALIDVGEALRRFVDEEIVVGESPFDSPVFTLPFDEGKRGKSRNVGGTSRSVGGDDDEGGHLHLSDSELDSYDGHIRFNDGHIHIDDDDDEDGGHIHIDDDEDGGGGGHIHIDDDDDDDDDDGGGHIHIDDDSPDNRGKRVTPARQRAIEQDGYGVNRYPRREPDGYGVDRYPRREPDGYGVDRYPRREPDGYGGDRYPQWGPNGYEANFNPPPQSGWQPYGYGTDQPYGMNAVDEPYAMNVVDQPYGTGWGQYGGNSNTYAYYMKSSGPSVRTVIHGQGPYAHADSYTGYPDASPRAERPTPPPPSPPSVWDYLDNVLETFNPDIYAQSAQGYSSIASSPDSDEVRVREGIPDLEEETETEIINEVHEQNNVNDNVKRTKPMPPKKGEGSRDVRSHDSEDSPRTGPSHSSDASRAIPLHNDRGKKPMISYNDGGKMAMPSVQSEGTSRAGPSPSQNSKAKSSTSAKGEEGSPDTVVTMSSENDYVQKRGVSFEAEEVSLHDVESSKTSSLTTSSTHGSRDIQEVVSEIKSEFEIASSHGKEVALMLEVGKLPYLPKSTALKVALSRIMHRKAPSSASSVARPSARVDSKTIKLARSYYGNSEKDTNVEYGNKASVLEEIYVWEKRLYKEVKVEERLRLIYEKLSKKLKALDDKGAESSKIDATRASIRRLLTKLNVCMRGIEAISSRIHKLRDEELQPRITKLIHGLTRMWKLILKCHRKQFQAIMDSKTRKLRSNTGFQKDSRLRATIELEMELRSWCSYFNDWITAQKSYVKSLNGWLFRCLDHEPEVTSDGIVPFSPGRIGAPLIFVTCHDWHQAMGVMKEDGVANSMQHFASNLRNLWERQDEEQRHRLKAEYLAKDYDKRMKGLRGERENPGRNQEAMSRKTVVASESGISRRDDLKVDLDSMRKRLEEERIRHSDAMKLVHDAASSSLQGGLVPIFKALENFSSVALTAHEQVRLQILEEGQ